MCVSGGRGGGRVGAGKTRRYSNAGFVLFLNRVSKDFSSSVNLRVLPVLSLFSCVVMDVPFLYHHTEREPFLENFSQ